MADGGDVGGDGGKEPAMDPAMMEKLMSAMGGGGEGGEGGGMDMAKLQAMLGGMGGGGMGGMANDPESQMRQQAQSNQQDAAAKNAGEEEGGADGKKFKWEQTSKYGESEILVRFTLADYGLTAPATKKDVKVVFKAKELKVTVAGEEIMNGKTFGTITIDDSTWCLVEKGSELQVLLALASDTKWTALLKD